MPPHKPTADRDDGEDGERLSPSPHSPSPKDGRGATFNPANRFEKWEIVLEQNDDWTDPDDAPQPVRTIFYKDESRSIIAWNDSPDIPFRASINVYRGCEHGCAYCYARPTHEYLGFSAGLDFETRIVVKPNAPELLRSELSKRSWKPQLLAMSGVTDCYQPVERKLELTRRCLEVLAEFRNPVAIVTKNHLVTRDIAVLKELARFHAISVGISLTTLDMDLAKVMEPRASRPARRLAAIEELTSAGIPVFTMCAPIIPGLNEHEIPALLAAAKKAGAVEASFTLLRLPQTVLPVFEAWVLTHFPDRHARIMGRIREIRSGRTNDPRFGSRMRGEGPMADEISQLFAVAKRRAGFTGSSMREPNISAFRVPSAQLSLFDE